MSARSWSGLEREALRHLTRCCGWFVLLRYRHDGLGAASEAMCHRGGGGRDVDGIHRAYQYHQARRVIDYREGLPGAPEYPYRLDDVLEWACTQLTAAEHARMDRLIAERTAGHRGGRPERELDQLMATVFAPQPQPSTRAMAGVQLDLFAIKTEEGTS